MNELTVNYTINRKKCDFKCKPEERRDNKMVFLKKIYEYV